MPDATRPELRCPSDLSRDDVKTPVLASVAIIDTSSMVHLYSSPSFTPCGIISAFSFDAHHKRSLRLQLKVVWYLLLIDDTERPALITGIAWLTGLLWFCLHGTLTTILAQGGTILEQTDVLRLDILKIDEDKVCACRNERTLTGRRISRRRRLIRIDIWKIFHLLQILSV